jgi:hypothetical protein
VKDTITISSESDNVSCENLWRESSNANNGAEVMAQSIAKLYHALIAKVDWVLPIT